MGWAPNYASAEELAEFARIGDLDDDSVLTIAIAAASRAIDRTANRQFGRVDEAVARIYTASWDRDRCRWCVAVDDIADAAGLLVAFDSAGDESYASTITPVRLRPVNAAADGEPWTELLLPTTAAVTAAADGIRVTALWGWAEVPDAIHQAALLQASRFVARRDSPFGVAGSPDAGSEVRLLARLDADVEVSIGKYKRWWGAV